jgi:hypothetical protein
MSSTPYSDSSANRASVGKILKPIFDKRARSLLAEEYNFFKYIKEADGEKIKLDGEDFVISVQYQRNDRAENFTEEGDLPFSGAAQFEQAKLRASRIAQPIQINHELKMLAQRDVATFATRLEMLWDDSKMALARTLNKQSVGDGTGVLTTATGALTDASATSTLAVADSSQFEENQSLDIWNSALGVLRNPTNVKYVVVSINSATQITVARSDGQNHGTGGASSVANTDKIVRAGSISGAAFIGMNGLQAITAGSGTTFMGLSGTTYAKWNATRVDAGGANIGPRLLGRAQIAARRVSNSAGKMNTIWCSPEQSLEVVYGGSGTYPDVRFSREDAAKASVKNQNKPTFNFGGQDIEVMTDLDLPLTKAIMFNSASLLVGSLHDVQLEDFDGQTSLPVFNTTTGKYKPADISWLTWRGNLGCFSRNEFVEVYGLPTPA